ncbi:MAG: alpha/beta hydrolase [Bacteroidales bacterium]|nr:alpha/beta hydrolase [Bacteroidales bacterium]
MFSQIVVQSDTSYTVQSAYRKYLKNFPSIEVVKAQILENVLEQKNIVYKEIGERKLHLDAFYNASKKIKPAVILIHGGAWKSGNKSHMEPLAQKIASEGYACFAVEYRLSPEAIFPAGIFDVKNAIQFIKENANEFNVDTSKVAVLGCSSGGQMAALIGATNQNPAFEEPERKYKQSAVVQAIIDLDGILAFNHPDSEEGTSAAQWLGGNFETNPDKWNQASALTHTNENTPPILYIGSQYPRFLAGRDDMIKRLDQFGIDYQTKTIENSPHTFWLFHPWFEETEKYITEFLDKNLK